MRFYNTLLVEGGGGHIAVSSKIIIMSLLRSKDRYEISFFTTKLLIKKKFVFSAEYLNYDVSNIYLYMCLCFIYIYNIEIYIFF
jgi:hypothetical protein